MTATWDCTAYGPEGVEVGALCFFADRHERTCGSLEDCRANMAVERQRVFERIHTRATEGDPDFQYLAREFTSPDQLLNADYESPEA